jgi:hypothetical protein
MPPGPKDHQHQGHFVDQLFRMFLNIGTICSSFEPPPPYSHFLDGTPNHHYP